MEGRFFYLVGIVYLTATLGACALAGEMAMMLGLLLVALLPISVWLISERRKKTCKLVMITLSLAVNLFNARYLLDFLPARSLMNQTAQLDGVVLELAGNEADPIYVVKATLCCEGIQHKNLKVLLYQSKESRLEPFDFISGQVRLYLPKKRLDFDFEKYNRAKGIFLCARPTKRDLKVTGKSSNFSAQLNAVSHWVSKNITQTLAGDQGAVMNGLLLGKRAAITKELKTVFKRAGIYHVLVVSGLHMSIVTQLIFWVFQKLRFGVKKSAMIAGVACLLFAAVIGPNPSVIRCAVMTLIYLIGRIVNLEADSRNSLGLSLTLLLIINPYSALDLGLQLSFLSTWAIVSFSDTLIKTWRQRFGACNLFWSSFCVSISASLATLPILMLNFEELPLAASISNAILSPIIPVAFVGSLLCGVLGPVFQGGLIYRIIVLVSSLVITLIIGVARIFASLRWLMVDLRAGYAICALLFLFLCAIMIAVNIKRIPEEKQLLGRRLKLVGVVFCSLLIVGFAHFSVLKHNTAELFVVPGKGSVLINCDGCNILIGADSTDVAMNQIEQCLEMTGQEKLNLVVDAFGVAGIEKVCSWFEVDKILSCDFEGFELLGDAETKLEQFEGVCEFKIGAGTFKVAQFKSGVVATFEYGKTITVILGPDIEESKLLAIVENASNLIMSKSTRLKESLLTGRNLVIYDLQTTRQIKKLMIIDHSLQTQMGGLVRLKVSKSGTKLVVES